MCYSESPRWVKFQFKIAMLDVNSYSVLLHGGGGAGGGGGGRGEYDTKHDSNNNMGEGGGI